MLCFIAYGYFNFSLNYIERIRFDFIELKFIIVIVI